MEHSYKEENLKFINNEIIGSWIFIVGLVIYLASLYNSKKELDTSNPINRFNILPNIKYGKIITVIFLIGSTIYVLNAYNLLQRVQNHSNQTGNQTGLRSANLGFWSDLAKFIGAAILVYDAFTAIQATDIEP